MEAVFKIDALKGCASKEDTCAHFKADIQASVDAESSESTNTVSLDKCKSAIFSKFRTKITPVV